MQESNCVTLILRTFRFIKLRILVLRCPENTIFGVLEALKFKIFRSSAPAPLGVGGGGGAYSPTPNPPGVSSIAPLDRKDTSLRSDPPPNSTTLASWLISTPISELVKSGPRSGIKDDYLSLWLIIDSMMKDIPSTTLLITIFGFFSITLY